MREYLQKYNIEHLYHMTEIGNLPSIIKYGICSHNEAIRKQLMKTDISDENVQDIRARIVDPFFNRCLHDYVPLYFSPRNPMLFRRQKQQDNIVILGIEPTILGETNVLFTDGNAASQTTYFYLGFKQLNQLPWRQIKAKYWTNYEDGKRIKCAEVLVYPRVRIDQINSIFCYSKKHWKTLTSLTQESLIKLQVKPILYF